MTSRLDFATSFIQLFSMSYCIPIISSYFQKIDENSNNRQPIIFLSSPYIHLYKYSYVGMHAHTIIYILCDNMYHTSDTFCWLAVTTKVNNEAVPARTNLKPLIGSKHIHIVYQCYKPPIFS